MAVGPGNVHFISVRQVSSDAATLRRGRCGHAAQWPTRPRFYAAAAAAADALCSVYMQFDEEIIIIIYLLKLNLKIRRGVIAENTVFSQCAKFNDCRFWNEKVLVFWKSDNNNPKKKNDNDGDD